MALPGRAELDQEVREILFDVRKPEPSVSLRESSQRVEDEEWLVWGPLVTALPDGKIAETVPKRLVLGR
nr:hypothetical protein [Salinibacter ruber]